MKRFGEGHTIRLQSSDSCPLKRELHGAQVTYCLLVLQQACSEYQGHCSYRNDALRRFIERPLGD